MRTAFVYIGIYLNRIRKSIRQSVDKPFLKFFLLSEIFFGLCRHSLYGVSECVYFSYIFSTGMKIFSLSIDVYKRLKIEPLPNIQCAYAFGRVYLMTAYGIQIYAQIFY